jgi:tetratricopeptide (TPR) repeat protein
VGDYTKSIDAHKSVLEVAQKLNDKSLELNALINLADTSFQNKNYQSAHGFALVALDLANTLDSKGSLILLFDLMGMIHSHTGDLKTALSYHQDSYQTALTTGDLQRQGIALANQGLVLERLTQLEDAQVHLQQAYDIFALINSDYLEKTNQDLQRIQIALESNG